MERNIDILKLISNEISEYLYADDELNVALEIEEFDIDELYDEDDSLLNAIEIHLFNIEELLDRLTEDFRDILDYEGFDCESFKWCIGKVRYNDFEIVNYIETFEDMMMALEPVIKENIRWHKMLSQAVTDDAGEVNEG